jgi:type II secretory pathway component PulF
MLFHYKAVDKDGNKKEGDIDAVSRDVAINSLQRRGLVFSSVTSAWARSFLQKYITLF